MVVEVGHGVTDFAPGDHVVIVLRRRLRPAAAGATPAWNTSATWARRSCFPGCPPTGLSAITPPTVGTRPPVEGRRILETHRGFVGFDREDRPSPLPLLPMALLSCGIPTGLRLGGEPRERRGRRHRRRHRRRRHRHRRHPGRAHQRCGADHRRRPGGVQAEIRLAFGATHSVSTAEEAADLVRDLTYGVMADGVVVSPSLSPVRTYKRR